MRPTALDTNPMLKQALKRHQKKKASRRPCAKGGAKEEGGLSESLTVPDAVIDAISFFGGPLRNQNIILLSQLKLGVKVPRTRFGTLRRGGLQRAIAKAGVAEGLYPLPALSALTFKPIEGFLSLSNWPLEKRLVAPQTEGLLAARFTLALLRLLDEVEEEDQIERVLRKMASDMCGKEVGYMLFPELATELTSYCEQLVAAHKPREEHSIQCAIRNFKIRFGQELDAPMWQLVGLPAQYQLS